MSINTGPAYIRVLAIDLDGTLLDSKSRVSMFSAQALALAQRAGISIVLATGKPYAALADLVQGLSLRGPHIVLGGGLIVQAPEETVLWQQGLIAAESQRIIEGLTELRLPFVVYYQQHSALLSAYSASKRIGHLEEIGEPAPLVCSTLNQNDTVFKILTFTQTQETVQEATLRDMASNDTQVVRTSPYLLEFIPRQGGKHIALAHLAQHMGIPLRNFAAIGDSENDRDMLEAAGWSVVMRNASESLQGIADWVVADNDSHGVAEAILRIVHAQE